MQFWGHNILKVSQQWIKSVSFLVEIFWYRIQLQLFKLCYEWEVICYGTNLLSSAILPWEWTPSILVGWGSRLRRNSLRPCRAGSDVHVVSVVCLDSNKSCKDHAASKNDHFYRWLTTFLIWTLNLTNFYLQYLTSFCNATHQ